MIVGDKAQKLVSNPSLYAEFYEEYPDTFRYFRSLRNSAPSTLDFEGYMALHSIFLDRDSGGEIREFVEENTARSLRNMVTRDSDRGRVYAVDTVAELESRRAAFASLEATAPEMHEVVATVIESLYDEDWVSARAVTTRLLSDTTGVEAETTRYLARVRATVCVRDGDDIGTVIDEYVSVTTPRVTDAPETAAECLDTASRLPYAERAALVQTALHRPDTPARGLFEYLRLSAFDDIEDARHSYDESDRPSRGGLGFAQFQLSVVEEADVDGASSTDMQWVRAYQEAAEGLIASGGYWMSTRDTPPAPDFARASAAFLRAATVLEPVHLKRAMTYLSKSYRMLSHTTTSSAQRSTLNDECIADILECVERLHPTDDRVLARILSLLQFHRMESLKWTLVGQSRSNNYDAVLDIYDECTELLDGCDHPSASLDDILPLADIARGVRDERNGDFEMARLWFDGTLMSLDDVPGHLTRTHITNRIEVTKYKEHVAAGEYRMAQECLDACENEYAILRASLDALEPGAYAGDAAREKLNRLPGITPGAVRTLDMVLDAHERGDAALEQRLVRAILRV